VVYKLFNKTKQELSAKIERGRTASLKKGGPRRPPRSPLLISTPELSDHYDSACA